MESKLERGGKPCTAGCGCYIGQVWIDFAVAREGQWQAWFISVWRFIYVDIMCSSPDG